MHGTKIIFYFLPSPNKTCCIITIGTGMLDTIFGIEIVRIKNIYIERTRDNTYINFYKLLASFRPWRFLL